MSPAVEGVLIMLALIVVAVAVGGCVYTMHRADEAVTAAKRARTSAEAAQVAAERAARHVDGLIALLADLSPSARRALLAARDYRSPAIALAHRRLAQQHGHRIDEGTT